MVYVLYFILAAIVVGLSIRISYYVDLIDKTTDISGAFIGGVMLAAVTSLPELFTSLSATLFLEKPELVMGNILGSNIFNITILATLVVIMYKKVNHSYISKSHTTVAALVIVAYGFLIFPMWFNKDFTFFNISIISFAIAILYIISIKKMASDTNEDADDETIHTTLTTKQIFARFALFSVLLVISSIGITFASDMIALKLNLDVTLAGALLLGIATSLPELASCIALVKIGNLNAMVGNILGSNIFNLFILLVADVSFTAGSLYIANPQSRNLVFFGLISMFAILGILIANIKKESLPHKTNKAIYVGGGIIPIISYILFLTLS